MGLLLLFMAFISYVRKEYKATIFLGILGILLIINEVGEFI